MSDQITMTELGGRWDITRQAAARLARNNPTFPPTTKQGRTVNVSWRAAKRWRERQQKDQLASAMESWERQRLTHLRGQLYRYAQRMDGRYAWMWIDKARTVEACYELAYMWRLNLEDFTVRPDGKPADYDDDSEYYDSQEYLDSLEDDT
ncbi:MAG: hypothetical protein DRQ56_10260 [Gammaproteobacteria bacterium]|nr:MAG: hypothetical protein DRQ56_10260 [Gammaproteobacteria bacterium]